jgi:hypothetical protein
MLTLTNRLGVAALTAAALFGVAAAAHAQLRVMPNSQSIVNPYFRIAPNLPLNQAAYNISVMGRAYQNVPPWLYGYNPYPSPIYSPYPPYPYPYTPPYGGFYGGSSLSATLSTYPYGGGYGAAGTLYSNPVGYGGGYGGYGYGYPYYYYQDPFSGYLTGAASVIQAQGQFMMNYYQSQLLNQEYRSRQIDVHRKLLEEWQYERNFLANIPDPRDVDRKFALHRALNDPPLTEILTGDALNAIANNIRKLEAEKGGPGPSIPINEELLKDINLTSDGRGNIGLLKKVKEGGKLNWPTPLQRDVFDEERKRIDQLLPDAVKRVEFRGEVDKGTLVQLDRDAKALLERLNASIREMTPTQYVEAKRYLEQLDDALTALQQPNAQNYLNGKWSPRGKTVSELIKNMEGLRFNAATQGDEQAYRALQQRLTAYNMALEQQTAQK